MGPGTETKVVLVEPQPVAVRDAERRSFDTTAATDIVETPITLTNAAASRSSSATVTDDNSIHIVRSIIQKVPVSLFDSRDAIVEANANHGDSFNKNQIINYNNQKDPNVDPNQVLFFDKSNVSPRSNNIGEREHLRGSIVPIDTTIRHPSRLTANNIVINEE